jgi:hypothetical protein
MNFNTKKCIRRLESELQNNCSPFSRSEESRLLNNIRAHKQGLVQFEKYEETRRAHDLLDKSHSEKKCELDENWRATTDVSQKLNIIKEELKFYGDEGKAAQKELTDMNTARIDLKKQLEDMIRENVKQQQMIKRANMEKSSIKKAKQPKE